jgi:hypothetical protein
MNLKRRKPAVRNLIKHDTLAMPLSANWIFVQSAVNSGNSFALSTGLARMGTWRSLRQKAGIARMSSSTR